MPTIYHAFASLRRITCRGDLDMLQQLSRPELNVLRYIHQHRGNAPPYLDHEIVVAALDIGRLDILKFFHSISFISFPSLFQEQTYENYEEIIFGMGFRALTPDEWTFDGKSYQKSNALKWNRSVRDEASVDQVAECVDFLRSAGAKVQSPTFLHRLLHRVRYGLCFATVSYACCFFKTVRPWLGVCYTTSTIGSDMLYRNGTVGVRRDQVVECVDVKVQSPTLFRRLLDRVRHGL